MSRIHNWLLVVVAASTMLATGIAGAAEGASVTFEAGVDFRAFRTFAIADGRINASKPEINNRLFRQRMDNAIRAALVSKGLKEVTDRPDMIVRYQISDGDFSVVERRQPVRIPGQDPPNLPLGPTPVLYTEGTLIIDMFNASDTLVWRGTYRDRETKSPSLSRNLSVDARKLLAKYPPRK
jgi:hypothetical protein